MSPALPALQARQRLGSYQSLGEPFEALVGEWWELGEKVKSVTEQLAHFEALALQLDAIDAEKAAEEARLAAERAARGGGLGGEGDGMGYGVGDVGMFQVGFFS